MTERVGCVERDPVAWRAAVTRAAKRRRKLSAGGQGPRRCRIFKLRQLGMSTRAIARHLAAENGLLVSHETVAALLRRHDPLARRGRRAWHRCQVCWRPTRNK